MASSDPNPHGDWEAYRYNPSIAAAIVFIVLFAATTAMHMFQMIRTRTWYFTPLVIGGFFETIGYIGRAVSSQQTPNWTLGPYIIQAIFLLVAPALFAASIYMTLGRLILAVDGESRSLIRKRWLTKFFVTGDVIAFFMQAGGGGIQAKGSLNTMHIGENVIVGGLFVQLLFFGFFIVTAMVFHIRLNKRPTPQSMDPAIPWPKHMSALYATSALILVRSIFRVVEYLQGNAGYLLRHEVFLYVFDAVLMLAVMVLLNVIHPKEITSKIGKNVLPTSNSVMEGEKPEMKR